MRGLAVLHRASAFPAALTLGLLLGAACGLTDGRLPERASLAAPKLLRVGHPSGKSTSGAPEAIYVTWTRSGSPDAVGYYLYRDTQAIPDPGPEGSIDPGLRVNGGNLIPEPPSGAEVTFVDDFGAAKPQIGVTYHYRVTVVDTADEESYPSNEMTWLVHGHNVAGLSPDAVYWGEQVAISGDTFGAYTAGTDSVRLQAVGGGTIDAAIDSWSETLIEITVPAGSATGKVQVLVEAVMAESDDPLTILNPYLTAIDPEVGFVEQPLLIEGDNFGAAQGGSTVAIGTADVSDAVTSWSNTQISLAVPDGVVQGDVVVLVAGVSGNGIQFTPRAEILGINLPVAQQGEVLVIGGRYFGATQGSLKLAAGDVQDLQSWTDTAITFTLVGTAGADGFIATTNDGIASNELPYTIQAALQVSLSGVDPAEYYTPATAPPIGVATAPDADSVELFIDGGLVATSIAPPFDDLVLPVASLRNGDHTISLLAHRRSITASTSPAPFKVYSLVGDVNGDGAVDGLDRDALALLVGLDQGNLAFKPWFDTDADGLVTEADLSAVGYFFGNTTL